MRRSIAGLALLATAAEAFAPVTAGGLTRTGLPNTRGLSGLRGGSARGLSSAKMASAHDFKLPLVGACPRCPRPLPRLGRPQACVSG